MGTAPSVSAPRCAALVALAAVLAACGGGNGAANQTHSPVASTTPAHQSPTAQPTATSGQPPPVTMPYGVLYSSQAAGTYTVSIIGIDGKVAASADVSTPPITSCASSAAAVVAPPLSMSNSRVYFMDAQGVVHFLAPSGDTGRAASVPAPSASQRAMFAVSPDDSRIAVVVDNFTASGASTRLYVEDVNGGGNHLDLFSESGSSSLWPIGWHGTNNLVLAVTPSCTQGGGPFCCGPQELHVVDPASATRRFTIGSKGGCVVAGPPSAGGVVCENRPDFTSGSVLNWTAGTVRTLAFNGPASSYLSPDGSMVMFVDNTGTGFTLGAGSISGFFACTWIDSTHVMSGGDSQHQPRVAEITTQAMVPVPAQGDCAGRLPGGL